MYAHQHHIARYSMLSHSFPHVPCVKNLPKKVLESVVNVYNHVVKVLDDRFDNDRHPFQIRDSAGATKVHIAERLKLRDTLSKHFKHNLVDCQLAWPANDIMFEACTVQPTDALGFHQDLMNCSSMDKTFACLVPSATETTETTKSAKREEENCLTYLFYSRKCVGDHVKKMVNIELYKNDEASCNLTVLCLRSIMHVGGIFDYQGSLFEATDSLESIALKLESDPNHCCQDIKDFTGLSCFKHGAAFDKMGYYSVFPNVFLSLYYKNIVSCTDDAISLCMFFGLLCNGTSALAAVWNSLYEHTRAVKKWLQQRTHSTKLFECLYKLFGKRFGPQRKDGPILYGNSKLPRFQYASQTSMIIDNAGDVHNIIKEFMTWQRVGDGKRKRATAQHDYLYKRLKKIKGIGPMSFNQLWHSMCLCGILPPGHIQVTTIGASSGPAKLIQTFYPYLKSAGALQKKLVMLG
jgi:hypothetical protein